MGSAATSLIWLEEVSAKAGSHLNLRILYQVYRIAGRIQFLVVVGLKFLALRGHCPFLAHDPLHNIAVCFFKANRGIAAAA